MKIRIYAEYYRIIGLKNEYLFKISVQESAGSGLAPPK